MIFRETAVAQGISGEDLREKEGCFLVRNDSAELVCSTATTDKPVGAVHIGADKGSSTTYLKAGECPRHGQGRHGPGADGRRPR